MRRVSLAPSLARCSAATYKERKKGKGEEDEPVSTSLGSTAALPYASPLWGHVRARSHPLTNEIPHHIPAAPLTFSSRCLGSTYTFFS